MQGDRATCLLLVLMTAAARGGVFELTVLDERAQRLPCRVLLRPNGGECIVPERAVVVRVGPDRWFVSSGQAKLKVPDGPAEELDFGSSLIWWNGAERGVPVPGVFACSLLRAEACPPASTTRNSNTAGARRIC